MTTASSMSERRFYRDADRAMLGGVCAGVARHLGFNLCATRFVTIIALFMTGPLLMVAYIAAVLLIPSASTRDSDFEVRSRAFGRDRTGGIDRRAARRDARAARRDARQARREARAKRDRFREEPVADPAVSVRAERVRNKCEELDARLQELEKTVTSRKFQFEQELSRS